MSTPGQPPSNSLIAGKYQLLGLIGRGGMGAVWEGRHVSLGTRVAIKFIEKEFAESQEARARFDNEARAAATIQSKHAIQIFDHGVTDEGKPYIVMELLEGEALDKRLERLGRLPLQDVARILNQVCRALQRAHERGIIHRDLKPENIFLVRTPDEDDEIAKVLDFGIAKMRGPGAQALSNSTKTGAVLGTPYYMSPEQARGLRDVDHRTDLWSLGVIVFKAVTGVLPFEGESLGDLLVKICTSPVPVPSHVLPGLPPAFDLWFARALDRDPNRRFATAQETADQLAYACGVSVRRGPASAQQQEQRRAELGAAQTIPSAPPDPSRPSYGATPPSSATPSGSSPGYARAGNVTSAPFTASSPRVSVGSSGSRRVLWAIVPLCLAAGAAVVLKLGPRVGVGAEKSTPAVASPGIHTPATDPPGPSAPAQPEAPPGLAPIGDPVVPPPLATTAATAASAASSAATAAIPGTPGKKPPRPGTAKTPASSLPPPTTAPNTPPPKPTTPAPATTKPSSPDPGY